jgi:ABC-type sugar transport system ATPase subunit
MMQPKDVPLSLDAPTSLNLSVDEAKKHLKFLQGLHTLGMTTIPISSKMNGSLHK